LATERCASTAFSAAWYSSGKELICAVLLVVGIVRLAVDQAVRKVAFAM